MRKSAIIAVLAVAIVATFLRVKLGAVVEAAAKIRPSVTLTK